MTNGPNPGDQSAPVPPPWIQNDYWAPDRAQVLADPSRWGPGPNATPAPPPAPTWQGQVATATGGQLGPGVAGAAPPAAPASVGNAGLYGGQTRDQWRDSWMGSGPQTPQAADAWLSAHGATQAPGSKNGTWMTPYGDTLDLQIGRGAAVANGGMITPGWTPSGGAGGGAGSPGAGAFGGNAAGTPGAAGASGGSPFQDSIRQQLLQILQNSQKPVDASDPQIAAEMNAQKVLSDRTAQQQRGAAAERAAFQGLLNGGQSSGSFDTTLQGINQDAGQQLMGFQAQLFSRAIQQKQSQLQQALSLAVQSGDAESARAIQMQIAQMENALRQQQLGQQQSQFNDSYGLQKAMYEQNQNNYALGGVI